MLLYTINIIFCTIILYNIISYCLLYNVILYIILHSYIQCILLYHVLHNAYTTAVYLNIRLRFWESEILIIYTFSICVKNVFIAIEGYPLCIR